ncbi:MAG: lytic transglycosylase domain-containing protein [Gallionella sp.]|nr:lytic transglycosylase domain-containing protein [Gallionella sp.]
MPVLLWLFVAACPAAIAAPGSGNMDYADTGKSATKIYKYLKNGTTSFSDVRPNKVSYIVYRPSCYACNVTSNIDWHSIQLHPDKYGEEIDFAARQFDLDPALVRAVIHAESGFNARARSPKGAVGLMQLMPGTARMLGVADARIPSHNIRGGAQYLAGLLAKFNNDVALAAAAYNAGPEAVQKYAGVPPYAETRVYVQRVKILHQRYKNIMRG